MKLEIEFENYEELHRKLYCLLFHEDRKTLFKDKHNYTVQEIKSVIKLYTDKYNDNYFDIIKNGSTICRAINYVQLINKVSELTWNTKAIIVQNSCCMSDIYIFT